MKKIIILTCFTIILYACEKTEIQTTKSLPQIFDRYYTASYSMDFCNFDILSFAESDIFYEYTNRIDMLALFCNNSYDENLFAMDTIAMTELKENFPFFANADFVTQNHIIDVGLEYVCYGVKKAEKRLIKFRSMMAYQLEHNMITLEQYRQNVETATNEFNLRYHKNFPDDETYDGEPSDKNH